ERRPGPGLVPGRRPRAGRTPGPPGPARGIRSRRTGRPATSAAGGSGHRPPGPAGPPSHRPASIRPARGTSLTGVAGTSSGSLGHPQQRTTDPVRAGDPGPGLQEVPEGRTAAQGVAAHHTQVAGDPSRGTGAVLLQPEEPARLDL